MRYRETCTNTRVVVFFLEAEKINYKLITIMSTNSQYRNKPENKIYSQAKEICVHEP